MRPNKKVATVTLNPAIDQTVIIPGFKAGHVNRVADHRSDAGGKGVNVASFLADWGLSVAATGFLGSKNAALFEAHFASKKIEDRFVRIEGSTRTGIKVVDHVNHETTDINFPGQAPTQRDVKALFSTVKALAAECSWVVLSGSIPEGVSEDVYGELIDMVKAAGTKIALDTSGEGFRRALHSGPDMIKPNLEELEGLVGTKLNTTGDIMQAVQGLLDNGISLVVVSMGEQGAVFCDGRKLIITHPPLVEVKSTVGAGDAMVAGIIAGLLQGDPLAECARLGSAFSAGAISHLGSGLPARETVEAFRYQVALVEEVVLQKGGSL